MEDSFEDLNERNRNYIADANNRNLMEKLTDFGTGATRCSDADEERFDLISPYFLQRLSKIMAQGAETHGEDNWILGIPISVTLNHLERHLNQWKRDVLSGEIATEDHLAKVAFGIMAICHYQAVGPLKWGSFTDKDRLKDYLGFGSKEPQIESEAGSSSKSATS